MKKNILTVAMWIIVMTPTWMTLLFIPPTTFWQTFFLIGLQVALGSKGLDITNKTYNIL